MDTVLKHVVEKISNANLETMPTENIYIEEAFPTEIYSQILARLPSDDVYEFIKHPDAIRPDGTITRKLLALSDESIAKFNSDDQAFWQQIKNALVSDELQQAIMRKFASKMNARFGKVWPELVTVPIFYRDYPGYFISIHPDAPTKVATLQFYLPKDLSQIHLGTSFHLRLGKQFHLLKTNAFKPNSAYAFARTDESWHSVQRMGEHESTRDSLALTIYIKGQEYKGNDYK